MNRLLSKQIERARRPDGSVDTERLHDAISAAYEEADRDRRRTERSIGMMVEELDVLHRNLESLVAERTEELGRVRSALEATLDSVTEGIIMFDDRGALKLANRCAAEFLQPDAEQRTGDACTVVERCESLSHPVLKRLIETGPRSREILFRQAELQPGVHFECIRTPTAEGGFVITLRDITDALSQEQALRQAEEDYRSLFENAVFGIYRSTPDGKQLRANPALVHFNGYQSESELIGKVNDLGTEWYADPERRKEFITALTRDGRITDFVSRVRRHSTGEAVWASETAWLVHDERGAVKYIEGMVIDATERMRAQARIEHLARYDQLTGLPNRTQLMERLEQETFGANGKPRSRLALFCLDIDNFKELNDASGHKVADDLLIQIGQRLRRIAADKDMVARFGADEFTVVHILEGDESADSFARKMTQAFDAPFDLSGTTTAVDCSIGVALMPDHGRDPEQLLRKMDIALSRAKTFSGSSHLVFEPAMEEALLSRRSLEIDLRSALGNGELQLYHQPIIDTAKGKVACHEALIRWHHPVRGFVSPGQFIPLAEDTGLIVPIGEWIIGEACRQANLLPDGIPVAVNLSSVQFRIGNIARTIEEALAQHGTAPERLQVEITESVLMDNVRQSGEVLDAIRALGVKIALDDFGTGYSSLSYLQKFAFDKIKIDRSFVSCIHTDPVAAALVRTILRLAEDLDAEVVVEGVETENQLKALQAEGCSLFQGYFFARPRPLREIISTEHIASLSELLKRVAERDRPAALSLSA
ncbi:MAG: EAL domain-containing protein [Hyphomicrobiaceae bacterium]|nr:EAL domain-containing protein [Hyphomicrobiaceae bacterium]